MLVIHHNYSPWPNQQKDIDVRQFEGAHSEERNGDILNLLHRMSFLAFQMDAGLGKFPYTLAKQLLGFGMVFLLLGFRGTAIFPRFVNLDLNCV